MNKAALTSIRKPHTDNIFGGIKGVEWRTRPMPTGKHYCYETKNGGGVGKVIGEFGVWRIKRYDTVSSIPDDVINAGCVSREFLHEYSKGRPLYAHFLINPKRYDKPKDYGEFKVRVTNKVWSFTKKLERPPQSWCYVESDGDDNG